MQDVAERANVSVQTVSNLVNGRDHLMSHRTRERVAQAMVVLDYRPNMRARGLRAARTNELGFLVVDDEAKFLADPMNGMVMAGTGEVTRQRGYGLLIHSARMGDIDDGLLSPLLESRVDGAILYLSGEPSDRDVYVKRVAEIGRPFVLFGEAREEGVPCVTAANLEGAYRLATHLLEQGHRRIAFIGGRASWPMIEQRYAGYRAALHDRGIEPARELQLFRGRWEPADGAAMAETLLTLRHPPTAIMAANDVVALGVFRTARNRGLRIPEDIAVTGFNDFDFSAFLHPALTTVSLPVYEMGGAAGRIVVDQIEGHERGRSQDFPVEILIRGSS
jgi:DNA-binding LacI/PurR family transcriptional regulator